MKTVFLHVGTHKTATTTLQRFLFLNREKLGNRGIFLPLDAECATRHGSFANALKRKSALSSQPFQQLKLDLAVRQPHTAILTSESFAPQLSRQSVSQLVGFFRELGYATHIVVYLRNQPEYISSRYAQDVKRFLTSESFDERVTNAKSLLIYDYRSLLSNVVDGSGFEFTVRPFDEAVRRGIHRDFLSLVLGTWDDEMESSFEVVENHANPSPGPATVFTAQAICRLREEFGPRTSTEKLSTVKLRRLADKFGWNESRFVGLTTELARDLEAHFRQSNDELARRVWGKDWQEVFTSKSYTPNVFDYSSAPESTRGQVNAAIKAVLTDFDERFRTDVLRSASKKYRGDGSPFGALLARPFHRFKAQQAS